MKQDKNAAIIIITLYLSMFLRKMVVMVAKMKNEYMIKL